MRRRVRSLCCAALVLSAAAAKAPGETVPIRVAAGVIFVEARINGEGPFTLIVDTGATETVLIPSVAERLGVRTVPISSSQRKGSVRSLAVGAAEANPLEVYVFDPPQAVPLRLNRGLHYHGLLGYSFLRGFAMTVDYRNSTMELLTAEQWRRAGRAKALGPAAHSVRFEVRNRLIHAVGAVDGRSPVTFLVDTGSAEVLLLPDAARRLQLPVAVLPGYEQAGVGLTRIGRLALGGAVVENVSTIIQAMRGVGHAAPTYDGILGYPFLSNYAVTVHYPERRLFLRPHDPGKDTAAPTEPVARTALPPDR